MNEEKIQDWKELIDARRQCDVWDYSKEIARQEIEEILRECHWRVPSKQNQMDYEVMVLDWSDPQLRQDIYEFATVWIDDNDPFYKEGAEPQLGRNPQVLAPWLLIFKNVNVNTKQNGVDDVTRSCEMGMLSMMITLAAKLRGLDSGFSRCIQGYDFNPELCDRLGMDRDLLRFGFFLGIGYSTPEWKRSDKLATMINPATGEIVYSGISGNPEESNRPRPKFEKIFNFV